MTLGIMLPDMFELRRLSKRRDVPVQMPQPAMNSWISRPNITNIRLKVLHIYGVEADDGREQPDVYLCDIFAEVIGCRRGVCLGQVFFDSVEG